MQNKMKEFVEKLPYLAPTIKVVSFKVERGFSGSDPDLSQDHFKISNSQLYEDVVMLQMLGQNNQAKNNGGYFGETTGSYWGGTGGDGVGFWH